MKLAGLFLTLLTFVSIVQAQSTGSLTGQIEDDLGSPLPGVSVEIKAMSDNTTLLVYADSRGKYTQANLRPGPYRIKFKLINFSTVIRDVEIPADGRRLVLNVVLPVAFNAEVLVTGKRTFKDIASFSNSLDELTGIADAASQGVVTSDQLDALPISRRGELLETVPGLIISQHSGEGKANQYYLRGFNLDHGTDLAVTVAGIPANFPTHGHGQGYSDINFLIPELISGIQFKKGPYYADEGDFASAGAVDINYANFLNRGIATADGGTFDYGRVLIADSPKFLGGYLLYGLELSYNDGPWDHPDNFFKKNGILRYSRVNATNGFSVTASGYDSDWNSTDQVARRAVDSGLIGRFGSLDTTDAGETHRYSLAADWQSTWSNALSRLSIYWVDYKLNLFSNSTYYLDDPVNGDQFEQADDRTVFGVQGNHRWLDNWGERSFENEVGIQFRRDDINNVGLYHTRARERLSITREDDVLENSVGVYAQNSLQWSDKVRTILGVRFDYYDFNVTSSITVNSGENSASIASPKATLVLGPWKKSEFYVNYGFGFHSNDARGTTIQVDPKTLEPASRVDPLVRTKGYEFGLRTTPVRNYHTTLAIFTLDNDSELLFVGDAGTTEPNRPSRRTGFEWLNQWKPLSWMTLETSFAFTHARFREFDPAGNYIPGSPEKVFSAGTYFEHPGDIFGSLHLRYFGPRPLIEDNSVRSDSSTVLNGRIGYKLPDGWVVAADLLNILNSRGSDIDYFYTSRLQGEPAEGIDDIHTHPLEPRSIRLNVKKSF